MKVKNELKEEKPLSKQSVEICFYDQKTKVLCYNLPFLYTYCRDENDSLKNLFC